MSQQPGRRKLYGIVAIVEGYGETEAVPILLTRWLRHRNFTNFKVLEPIRATGTDAIKQPYNEGRRMGVEHFVHTAISSRDPDAILVILDADDDCPAELAPKLLARAKSVTNVPIGVVLANRQYETWFLASLRTLQRAGEIPADAKLPRYADIEVEQGCKDKLSKILGRKYNERNDQPEFTEYLSFRKTMKSRSRSYRHLLDTLERLTLDARNREI